MKNFNEWFDVFTDKVRSAGYSGPIDRESAEIEFDDNLTPDQAAKEFVEEMKEYGDM